MHFILTNADRRQWAFSTSGLREFVLLKLKTLVSVYSTCPNNAFMDWYVNNAERSSDRHKALLPVNSGVIETLLRKAKQPMLAWQVLVGISRITFIFLFDNHHTRIADVFFQRVSRSMDTSCSSNRERRGPFGMEPKGRRLEHAIIVFDSKASTVKLSIILSCGTCDIGTLHDAKRRLV